MAVVFDQKSESGFVFGSVLEFIKCWEAGADSRLILETCNGKAWVNFSCCLGRPNAHHVLTKKPKSPRREFKDNMRAAAHNAKNEDDVTNVEDVAVTANSDTTDTVDAHDSVEFAVGVTPGDPMEDNMEKGMLGCIIQHRVLKKNIEDNIPDVKIEAIERGDFNEYTDSNGKYRIQFKFKVKCDKNDGSYQRLRFGITKLAMEKRRLDCPRFIACNGDKGIDLTNNEVNVCFEDVLT